MALDWGWGEEGVAWSVWVEFREFSGSFEKGSLCDGCGGQRLTGLVASEHGEICSLFAGGVWKRDEV